MTAEWKSRSAHDELLLRDWRDSDSKHWFVMAALVAAIHGRKRDSAKRLVGVRIVRRPAINPTVMAGLDPAIHLLAAGDVKMDARIKSAHDDYC
jgi:hypothetical protein